MIAHNRFHSLDGLRGFAAIAVMIHHCDARFLPGGYLAVDFFFCLSGLAIARSYGEKLGELVRRHAQAWQMASASRTSPA